MRDEARGGSEERAGRDHDRRETNDDADAFVALYATAHLFGAPFDEQSTRTFATGGPLGDAILFAMLTAPRSATLARMS